MAGEIPVATATVAGQDGDRVLVSVSVAGFPPGFQLRAGDKVAVAVDDAGLVARPLLRTRVVRPSDAAARTAALAATAPRYDVPASDNTPAGTQVVFETESEQGPARVVAIREAR